jgi:hypothetical protein
MRYLIKLIDPERELKRLQHLLESENNFYWKILYQLEIAKIFGIFNKGESALSIINNVYDQINLMKKDEEYVWLLAKLAEAYAENEHINRALAIVADALHWARELKSTYDKISAMIRILQIVSIFTEYNKVKDIADEIFENIKNIDDPLSRLELFIMLGNGLKNEFDEYRNKFIDLVKNDLVYIQDKTQRFQIMTDLAQLFARWNLIDEILTILSEVDEEYWRSQIIWDVTSGFFESGNIEKMIEFAEKISGESWEKSISPEILSILMNPIVIIDVQEYGTVNNPYIINFYTMGHRFNIEPLETWVDLSNVSRAIGGDLEVIKYVGKANIVFKPLQSTHTKVKVNIALGNLRGYCWVRIDIK